MFGLFEEKRVFGARQWKR